MTIYPALYLTGWASLVAQIVKTQFAMQEGWFDLWVRKTPWRRTWQLTPVFLPGASDGQRSLVCYSPQSCKGLDRTEGLTVTNISHEWAFFHGSAVKNLHASAGDMGSIPGSGRSPGRGNGNPLLCYCLVNPTDRGAWWATVHEGAKSQIQLSN